MIVSHLYTTKHKPQIGNRELRKGSRDEKILLIEKICILLHSILKEKNRALVAEW